MSRSFSLLPIATAVARGRCSRPSASALYNSRLAGSHRCGESVSAVAGRKGLRFYATHPLKYTKDHEWVQLHEDGQIATVGITDYAAKALGDVVFVEIPEVGTVVKKEDPVGAVESVKAASDIYAPVSGEVVEANKQLESKSGLINTSPFKDGWLCKIKVSKQAEFDELLDEAAYGKLTKE